MIVLGDHEVAMNSAGAPVRVFVDPTIAIDTIRPVASSDHVALSQNAFGARSVCV